MPPFGSFLNYRNFKVIKKEYLYLEIASKNSTQSDLQTN